MRVLGCLVFLPASFCFTGIAFQGSEVHVLALGYRCTILRGKVDTVICLMRDETCRVGIVEAIGKVQVVAPHIFMVQVIEVAAEQAIDRERSYLTTGGPVVQEALVHTYIEHAAIYPCRLLCCRGQQQKAYFLRKTNGYFAGRG